MTAAIDQVELGNAVEIIFTFKGDLTGASSVQLFNGLTLATLPVTVALLSGPGVPGGIISSVYSAVYLPTTTGRYTLISDGAVVNQVDVVERKDSNLLLDLMDEAYGNWTWDRETNSLTLFKLDGTEACFFRTTDSPSGTSRTKIIV